jgi:hypothetical protein
LLLATISGAVEAQGVAAHRFAADTLPTASAVLAHAQVAIGGERLHNAAARMSTVAACVGPSGAYTTRTLSSPHVIRFEQDFTWTRDSVRLFVAGDSGWASSRRSDGPMLSKDQQLFARLHDFQRLFLRPQDLLTLNGRIERATFEGRAAFVLTATIKGALPAKIFYDVSTKLPLGIEHAAPGDPSGQLIRVVINEWRPYAEGRVVAALTIHQSGKQWTFRYDSVVLDNADAYVGNTTSTSAEGASTQPTLSRS